MALSFQIYNKEKSLKLLKDYKGLRKGFVQVGEKKWFYPLKFIEESDGYYNFKARPDDTWIMSHPRSGTTWMQELIWLVVNDLDFDTAKNKYLLDRFPSFEWNITCHREVLEKFLKLSETNLENQQQFQSYLQLGFETLRNASSPRFIQTHFPLELQPGILEVGCKIVYVARHPKDVVVSWYHLSRDTREIDYQGDFATFLDDFINGTTLWGPYWEHIMQGWNNRHHSNFLFVWYEDMIRNLPGTIRSVAEFFNKSYNEVEISKLVSHLNFKNFQNNPAVNLKHMHQCNLMKNENFIRKGKCGGYKEIMTPALELKMNSWIETKLKQDDIRLPNID